METDYLDGIFRALHGFSESIRVSERWLTRAEQTSNRSWRLSFLCEARRACDAARPQLEDIVKRLGPSESPSRTDDLVSPLEMLRRNIPQYRASYDTQEAKLVAFESALAESRASIGRA